MSKKMMNNVKSKPHTLEDEIERFNMIEARLQSLERNYNQNCSLLKEQSDYVVSLTREMKKNKIKKIMPDHESLQNEEIISYA